ncbi:unnamed protein product [Vicia faba]|uniref:TF-B3 domain-containing protein n=1 Tax=Vicia faba TaxID=3906 RepID=A0AAV1AWV3_VICFA|nr:unnamed protein product [Vicia faba]
MASKTPMASKEARHGCVDLVINGDNPIESNVELCGAGTTSHVCDQFGEKKPPSSIYNVIVILLWLSYNVAWMKSRMMVRTAVVPGTIYGKRKSPMERRKGKMFWYIGKEWCEFVKKNNLKKGDKVAFCLCNHPSSKSVQKKSNVTQGS